MSQRYSFLRTPRWIGIAGLTVLIAAVCVTLGFWQLSRHEYRAEAIARVESNSTQPAEPLTELLTSATTVVGDDLEWRAVTVTGSYVGGPVALPQRGVEAGPADHALGVLAVTGPDGEDWLLVVDRGSYPTDAFTDSTDRLELPEGEIDLVLRLRPAEEASGRDQIPGQVFRINPEQVVEAAGGDLPGTLVTDSYAWVVTESPTTANPPTPIPVPSPNYRSNLSYAMQWWTFGLLAFIGYGVLARRERGALDREAGLPVAPPKSRKQTDADLEDAEIEAAQAAQANDTSSV
jgi:cytochrome oxidase assembly protein ShyY1